LYEPWKIGWLFLVIRSVLEKLFNLGLGANAPHQSVCIGKVENDSPLIPEYAFELHEVQVYVINIKVDKNRDGYNFIDAVIRDR
jgi:hypothetical protein